MTERSFLTLDSREPPIEVGAEVVEFLGVVGQFARQRLAPMIESVEETDLLDPALVDALAAQGLLDLGAPAGDGGADADLLTVALVVEHLSESFPLAGAVVASVHSSRVAFGHVVPYDHLGAVPVVIDLTDPTVSLDVDTADGSVVVDGNVRRLDGAANASALVITRPEAEPVVVNPSTSRMGHPRARTGLRGWSAPEVGFSLSLGREYPGVPATARRRTQGTRLVLLAAVGAGIAIGAWRAACSYAARRRQFGRTLEDIPAVARLLDEILTSAAMAQRDLAVLANADLEECVTAAFRVAKRAAHAAIRSCDLAIQVHGGYGYMEEYPVARGLRDAVTLQAMVAAVAET